MNRQKHLRNTTLVIAASNLGLGLLMVLAGVLGKSDALLFESAHALIDVFLALFVGLLIITGATRKGKREKTVRLIIVLIMIALAGIVIFESIETIIAFAGGARENEIPNYIALIVAVIVIVVKSALFVLAKRVGTKYDFKTLIVSALHQRMDALITSATLLSIVLAIIIKGFSNIAQLFDPIITIIIALYIAWEAVHLLHDHD